MPWFERDLARIHYEEHGEGEPLLLMHGFTDSAREMSGLIDALAPHYRVIAPDLQGYGRSEPRPRNYTPSFYHDDAHDMAALLEHLGTGPAHIVGFSDGGEVAILMPIHHPDMARSVVAWGAVGTLGTGDLLPDIESIYHTMDEGTGRRQQLLERYGEEVARG